MAFDLMRISQQKSLKVQWYSPIFPSLHEWFLHVRCGCGSLKDTAVEP